MADIGSIELDAKIDTSQYEAGAATVEKTNERIKSSTKSVGDSQDDASKKSGGFSKAFSAGWGAVAGIASSVTGKVIDSIGGLVGEMVEASDSAEQFKSTLQFAGIDNSKIEELTKSTQKYADQTVFDLTDIRKATASLAANGVPNYDKLAEAAGNLTAVNGEGKEAFKSVAQALTQTAGAGKLTTENWNQLTDAISGASGPLQKTMKKNGAYTGDFREAMANGEITAEEFNQALLELGMDDKAVKAAKSTDTFSGSIGNLQAAVIDFGKSVLDKFKPAITDAINAVSDFVGKLSEGFKTAFDKVSDFFNYVSGDKQFKDAVDGIVGSIVDMKNSLSDSFDSIKDSWSKMVPPEDIKNLVGSFMGFIKDTVELVTDSVKRAVDWWSRFFKALQETGAVQVFVDALGGLFDALGNVVKAFSPANKSVSDAKGQFDSAKPAAELFGGALKIVGDAIKFVSDMLNDAVQHVKTFFGELNSSGALKDWFDALGKVKKAIEDCFNALGDLGSAFDDSGSKSEGSSKKLDVTKESAKGFSEYVKDAAKIVEDLADALEKVAKAVQSVADFFNKFKPVAEAFGQALKFVSNPLGEITSKAIELFSKLGGDTGASSAQQFKTNMQPVQEASGTMKDKLKEVFNSTGNVFDKLSSGSSIDMSWSGGIGTTFDGLKDHVGQFLGRVGELPGKAQNSGSGFLSNIGTNISKVPGVIQTNLDTAFGSTERWGSDMKSSSEKTGSGFTSKLINGLYNMPSNVRRLFETALTYARDWASKLPGEASKAGSNFVDRLMGFISSLPRRILGAFSNAGNLLRSAGSAIMNSLLSGLRSAWGNVTSFVNNIAGWIRDHKGPISYDKKLLIPAGNAIMSGLNEGLQDSFGDVKDTVSDITGLFDPINDVDAQANVSAVNSMASSVTPAPTVSTATRSYDTGTNGIGSSGTVDMEALSLVMANALSGKKWVLTTTGRDLAIAMIDDIDEELALKADREA